MEISYLSHYISFLKPANLQVQLNAAELPVSLFSMKFDFSQSNDARQLFHK